MQCTILVSGFRKGLGSLLLINSNYGVGICGKMHEPQQQDIYKDIAPVKLDSVQASCVFYGLLKRVQCWVQILVNLVQIRYPVSFVIYF